MRGRHGGDTRLFVVLCNTPLRRIPKSYRANPSREHPRGTRRRERDRWYARRKPSLGKECLRSVFLSVSRSRGDTRSLPRTTTTIACLLRTRHVSVIPFVFCRGTIGEPHRRETHCRMASPSIALHAPLFLLPHAFWDTLFMHSRGCGVLFECETKERSCRLVLQPTR